MIYAGTAEYKEAHNGWSAAINLGVATAIPIAVTLWGIGVWGFQAVLWPRLLFAGGAGAFAFFLVSKVANRSGATSLDFADVLGSTFARPHSSAAFALGICIHLTNGALLAVPWVYGSLLSGFYPTIGTALVWASMLWLLGLLLLTSVGAVHPGMRGGEMRDPGPAAVNFGRMTPWVSLAGHLAYALVIAWIYPTGGFPA